MMNKYVKNYFFTGRSGCAFTTWEGRLFDFLEMLG